MIIKQIPRSGIGGAMLSVIACLAVSSALADDLSLPARPLTFVEKFSLVNRALFGNADFENKEWVYALSVDDINALKPKEDVRGNVEQRVEQLPKSSFNVRIILLKKVEQEPGSRQPSYKAEAYKKEAGTSDDDKVLLQEVLDDNKLRDSVGESGYIGFLPTNRTVLRHLQQALDILGAPESNKNNKIELQLQPFIVEGKFKDALPQPE